MTQNYKDSPRGVLVEGSFSSRIHSFSGQFSANPVEAEKSHCIGRCRGCCPLESDLVLAWDFSDQSSANPVETQKWHCHDFGRGCCPLKSDLVLAWYWARCRLMGGHCIGRCRGCNALESDLVLVWDWSAHFLAATLHLTI